MSSGHFPFSCLCGGNFLIKTVFKHKGTGIAIVVIAIVLLAFGIYKLNDFNKAELVSTQGRTFEKAVVTGITKDNLAEDGERYGNQEVILEIKSGELKGQRVEATSPNGTLFGAACTVGMNVIAIVSITGEECVYCIQSGQNLCNFLFCSDFCSLPVACRRQKGAEVCLVSGIIRFIHFLCFLSSYLQRLFAFFQCGNRCCRYNCNYDTCGRRYKLKIGFSYNRNGFRSVYGRSFSKAVRLSGRNKRL